MNIHSLSERSSNLFFVGFTGIDAPYQVPEHPDVIIDTNVVSVDRSIVMITEKLAERVSE